MFSPSLQLGLAHGILPEIAMAQNVGGSEEGNDGGFWEARGPSPTLRKGASKERETQPDGSSAGFK